MKTSSSIFFLIFLVGCAPSLTIGEKFVLNDIECQWAEISASLSSKQLDTLCKDKNGNWQLVATVGRPGGQVISEIIRAAALGIPAALAVQAIGNINTGTDISIGIPGD